MKRFLLTIAVLVCFGASVSAQEYNETDVLRFREIRDEQFRNRLISPLKAEDFTKFAGLNYYPIAESYCVKAVYVETTGEKSLMMPTSAGFAHKYKKVGVLKFELGGQELALNAYRREYEASDARATRANVELFIPFRDETSGGETYAAGRYITLKMPETGAAILDFNLAYNPSCAYGDPSFSCPIPPKENFLRAEIKAGEKIYKGEKPARE